MTREAIPQETLACLMDCGECVVACEQTAYHCQQIGGMHASAEHQGLLRDCIEICALAIGFMSRSSRYAVQICRQCARICTACADSCDRLASGDGQMVECAEVCRKCAGSCETMSAAEA
jgi:hypothetical protein